MMTRSLKKNILCFSSILTLLLCGCEQEFDKHYEPNENSASIKKNLIEILEERPDFSLFVDAIERLELRTTLGESAIYTCLAPRNKDVKTWLTKAGYSSIEDVPEKELRVWLNYHFIMGMYYAYDFRKRLEGKQEDHPFYYSENIFKTREEEDLPGKFVRIYTEDFLMNRGEDYNYIMNKPAEGFSVDRVSVSDSCDIGAANGVVHILEAPLEVPLRADEAIAAEKDLSIINMWLDRFVVWNVKGVDETGKVDTTKIKSYNFGADIADESRQYTFLAPTDQAIKDFFDPYLEENFYGEYDSIPTTVAKSIITIAMSNNEWGMSDLVRGGQPGNMLFRSINHSIPLKLNKVEPYYETGVLASNAHIYKLNKMVLPPILTSVDGGIIMNRNRLKQINLMADAGYYGGATDILEYNHVDRTYLVQPDEYWTKDVEIDYPTSADKDTLSWSLGVGMLNIKLGKEGFENNKFYHSAYGSLLYKDGQFIDYKGTKANLLSNESIWDAKNGSIYEIDAFFDPIRNADTTQTIYKMHLRDSDTYNLFAIACDLTGVAEELNEIGYFSYTIFAPTDQAFIDAGLDDLSMPLDEMEELVRRHIVQRKIFSDGDFSGDISTLSDELVNISGAWDSFKLRYKEFDFYPMQDQINQQANNGVLHGISTIIQ